MTDRCSREPILSFETAREKIAAAIKPVSGVETVTLKLALGRVAAEPVHSPSDIPHHRNAAVDGYAFSSRDIDTTQAFRLRLAAVSWAGKPFQEPLVLVLGMLLLVLVLEFHMVMFL